MVRPEVSNGSEAQHALRATDLHKMFGAVTALSGVSFSIDAGEFVTLLGPSGCGKSTILRILAGIETPTRGAVTIGGETVNDTERRILVPPERRDLSMVFQSYAVWPHMTVATNVAFPLRYRKVPRSERRARVTEALRAVRMEQYVDRYPHQLSGGQQQRVAVARSIVGHPALLLLDEPLSNLDARLREDMRVELKRLHLELGLTMLYVTHDQSEALAMSDRILVMDHGLVLQEGAPEDVYRSPGSLTVARFLGVKNIVAGRVSGDGVVEALGGLLPATLAEPMAPGTGATVAIRPDGFSPAEEGSSRPSVSGEIRLAQFLGGSYEHEIDVGGTMVIAQSPQRLGDRGDIVNLSVDPAAVIAFPADESAS